MLSLVLQDILTGQAKFVDNHTVKYGLPGRVDVGGQVTAKDIIIATGSVPFVPPGEPNLSCTATALGTQVLQQQQLGRVIDCQYHSTCRCQVQVAISGSRGWHLVMHLSLSVFAAGIPIDGKTVFTSDHALKLEWLPNWIAIIGSGYIGLEFSDVYTALGCEVTFIEVCWKSAHVLSAG